MSKNEERIISINKIFQIINWHSDGVFHGTVEGLTRIVPYIDYLLKHKEIYIHISTPRYNQNTAEKILVLLGFEKKRIIYGKFYVKHLYVPTPFYCVKTSTPLIVKFNYLLRRKMLHKKCLNVQNNFILLLQRSNGRIIYNINILKRELLKTFNYSVIVYHDKNTNLDEVYCWFTHASIIIGYHGSGLTNIYFSREKAIVVELSPKYPVLAFAKIGSQIGLKYYIYRMNHKELYVNRIHVNISLFVNTLKDIL